MDNKSIRQIKRVSRRNMSVANQQNLSSCIVKNIVNSKLFKKSQNIALYLSNDSEPDLSVLIDTLWAMGKNCYLPLIGSKFESRLSFQLYTADSTMKINQFGIAEPIPDSKTRIAKSWLLDLILMPLVAFDNNGNRIGMGGGFYDKTLYYRRYRTIWQKPCLMGVAYSEQQVPMINNEHWDVALDYIATDRGIKAFNNSI